MSFMEFKYLYYIIPLLVLFLAMFYFYEKKALRWINKYFFKKTTYSYWVKTFFFFLGIIFLALASLDLRGPEEMVEIDLGTQQTILLIDASLSMAVEDIKPNRFSRALMIARHFVKKAVGHKISIFIFSGINKQVVPFTDDIDHLEARIEAINQLRTLSGTSNVSVAINEVTKYFKSKDGTNNIIVFTDGEEHISRMKVEIGPSTSLAMIGVGTAKGGKIPKRDRYGSLRGFKKHKGKEVVSKLNDNFFKQSFSNIKNYKYWIVNSYTIPTEEVLTFLKKGTLDSTKGSARQRKVLGHYLMVPGVVFLIISYLFSLKVMVRGLASFLLILMMMSPMDIAADFDQEEFNILLGEHKKGQLSKSETKKLARGYLQQKKFDKAIILYEDVIRFPETESRSTLMNYGTALIADKKLAKGVSILELAMSKVSKDEKEIKDRITQNILRAIKQMEQDKKDQKKEDKDKKKDNKNNKDKEDKKDEKKKEGDKKNKENKENKKNEKGEKKDKKKSDDEKQKKEDNKSDKDKKGDQKDKGEKPEEKNDDKKDQSDEGKNDKTDPRNDKRNSKEQKDNKIKRKKLKGLLKEILGDDKKLQKMLLDTSRKKEQKGNDEKDW